MIARSGVQAFDAARPSAADGAPSPANSPSHVAAGAAEATPELQAVDVTKQFGGLNALSSVSLALRAGEVHGLIGPNGSGKTTLLNLLSGYYQPTSGVIRLGAEDLSRAPVQRRAAAGIARTFQKPRLLPMLSVLENAVLGAWTHAHSGFLATTFGLPSVAREDKVLLARATELLHGVGLGHVLHRRANLLDHAEQRFLEIARGLAMRPKFILLDEPAGGLTSQEIGQLADVVRTVRDSGIGVLLVEHHTDFVFRICDRVTTLNVGRMIHHGLPDEVRQDPEVIRVYLGA
jgi:ABC-type branched-subunit amino acid transport system ATPase component